jgi:malto-oligosyltrehalose synthase/4-alpha-glucanotransferase
MFNPVSTYRIQFHKDFTFKNLDAIIPYLQQLGIKTLYASPIFEATPGSTHGYDVVDPLNINSEIGTLDELRSISSKLKRADINWLQDIVPNHMAFHPNNRWLMDVLENGKESAYATFFDILWDSEIYDGRIMVPFLGVPFDEAVEQKQIQLIKNGDKFAFAYFDQQYPVKIQSAENFTSAYIKKVNNDPQLLQEIATQQAYQLCHWQETDRQINYRRFFTVNGLICLNMQYDEVFTGYHQLIKQLLDEGIFQGLRIDHIDGLYDPEKYFKQLRELAGPDVYITVEKILEKGEQFPSHWPVEGNTGYDFLAIINNLFTNTASERIFTDKYQKLVGNKAEVEDSILEKKAFILKQHMAGELENLYQLFISLNLLQPDEIDVAKDRLKEAIAELLIHCPVYRFYGNAMPLNAEETELVKSLFHAVGKSRADLKPALQLLSAVLLDRTQRGDTDYNERALRFYQRLMQFTGPLMAKGVEDTLMYTYNRFIGHNEVGDAPAAFGLEIDEFHCLMIVRQQNAPLCINATSTHDTKRGEDVRTRLNVLTDMPNDWFKLFKQWQTSNVGLKTANAPDKNDEYFIYQSLIGAHPMPESGEDEFSQRMQEYLIKALREGKQNSDWASPNEQYEEGVKSFIAALLDKKGSFTQNFAGFHRRVADFGIVNSLSQTLLKFTCPGVPDVYQGCERWDLSLVDPDNRRRVDYQLRNLSLQESPVYNDELWQQLWESRYNGEIKQTLIKRLLAVRSAEPDAFVQGDYIPLTVTGKYKNNVLAFARQFGNDWYVTAVPLHLAAIGADQENPVQFNWQDTSIKLPDAAPQSWKNLLSETKGHAIGSLQASSLFTALPVTLLKLERPANRSAGLLMHLTSLPSPFGLGDMGKQAYKFIDLLFNSGQRYWQMLPVNPVDKGAGYSPYSATSSMAGNTLLISPEILVAEGWLDAADISATASLKSNRADFDGATRLKTELFDKAYHRFIESDNTSQADFKQFKLAESYWLDDFALYQVFKQLNNNKPWYEWDKASKSRNQSALTKAFKQHAAAIDKEKWLQYIFAKQWQGLKAYATKKAITIFGDMPFYISYDSVDVWSHPELFSLDQEGKIAGIAGVPPDYFSEDGQLWGMPVYNWEVLKQNNYDWWLQRIKKNLEYFDLIRLDHFRAFSTYWEVPGGEKTAVNGKWMQGPGADLFDKIKEVIGHLPFVAEDLGDVDDAVFQLRDAYELPGMKVLQFAFGEDMPDSDHIPHNHTINSFAYTGTHDNNTTIGWFEQETQVASRLSIAKYTAQKISERNICDVLIRLCYGSVAKVIIVPMQDVLKLDSSQRMNMPGSGEGNWTWQVSENQLSEKVFRGLLELTRLYNR